jgi:hypothetical protein
MKRILILAALASTAVSAPSFAQSTSTDPVVSFEGDRAQVCEVRNFDQTVDFGTLSEFGAATTAKTDEVELYCNVRFDAEIKSLHGFLRLNTLVSDAAPTSQSNLKAQGYTGFASAVNYTVNTIIGNASTANPAVGANTPVPLGTALDPINLTTTVTYNTVAGSLPLLGGDYLDTVTLTITPVAF